MLLNGSALNRAALNGVALLYVAVGACTGAAGATGTALPLHTHAGSASTHADCSVSLTSFKTRYGTATAQAGVLALAAPTQEHAGRVSAAAGATGVAHDHNLWYGAAGGDAGATGWAIADALLGEASGSAGAAATAAQTLQQFTRALATGSATAVAPAADRTRFVLATAACGATGYGDWKYQATGTSVWLHDGLIRDAAASGALTVDETMYKVVITLGVIQSMGAVSLAHAQQQHMARAAKSAGMAATAIPTKIAHGAVTATAGALATVVGTRRKPGAATAAAGAVVSYAAGGVSNTQQAAAGPASGALAADVASTRVRFCTAQGLTVVALGYASAAVVSIQARASFAASVTIAPVEAQHRHRYWGEASASAAAVATAEPTQHYRYWGASDTSGSAACAQADVVRTAYCTAVFTDVVTISVFAVTNSEIPAHESRTMTVPSEDRSMFVPNEDRLLRVAA